MQSNRRFITSLLVFVSAGHLLTGALMLLGQRGVRLASPLYGAHFEPDDQFSYIIRPAGVFLLGMGSLQLIAAREPARYKGVIDVSIGILALRVLQRLVYGQEAMRVFGIHPARHWANAAFFGLLAGLLALARRQIESSHQG